MEKKGEAFLVTLDNGQSVAGDRVVIATGLTPYDPVDYKGRRVLTSLEYDALIDQAKADLPADFNRVAFVLCVGSRSEEYPLCSSVCCSYTIREIKWTLQRAKPEITVFYNDLRLFGQEFYMEKIYRDAGVRFVRANSRYFEEEGDEVKVRYFTGGKLVEEAFDYVVLAIGLRPNPTLGELSGLFGFSLNQWGFVKEEGSLRTDVEGIYACGGALEPMSIKDSILTGFGAGFIAVQEGRQPAVGRREALQGRGAGDRRCRWPLRILPLLPGDGRRRGTDVLRVYLPEVHRGRREAAKGGEDGLYPRPEHVGPFLRRACL